MINLSIDSLLESTESPYKLSKILDYLQQLSNSYSNPEPLLIQLHDQHATQVADQLPNLLHRSGWRHDRIIVHQWSPIAALHPQHPTNQILRNHAAASHGAHVDLLLANWPQPTASTQTLAIPQALLLMDVGVTLTGLKRLKTLIERRRLCAHLNHYAAISIELTNPLSKVLRLNSSEVVAIPQLLNALEEIKPSTSKGRRSLAWVTPMPPLRSGIATYAATLLPALQQHYDVTVITDSQENIAQKQQTTQWLLNNGYRFDRICYHIGNSPFHQTIQDCAMRWPGSLVLHELYLGDLQFSYEGGLEAVNQHWLRELYRCHGFHAIWDAARDQAHPLNTLRTYPTNRQLIQRSLGSIVHSLDAEQRLKTMLPQTLIAKVPMVNALRTLPSRNQAREFLGIDQHTIQICSVGMVGAGKGSLDILRAWSQLPADIRDRSQLIFLGDNDAHDYGKSMLREIERLKVSSQVMITGWTPDHLYNNYLAGSDFAIQLRTISRGESSAAVLDVISSSIPTIVNANASMRELPSNSVLTVPDAFQAADLYTAMQTLISDLGGYRSRACSARVELQTNHAPDAVGKAYRDALEDIYACNAGIEQEAIRALATSTRKNQLQDSRICNAIARTFKARAQNQQQRQLLVDVTQIAQNDLKTGIQRVVRSIVLEWIKSFDDTVRIEPVVLSTEGGIWHYRYARAWTFDLIGYPSPGIGDEPIEVTANDHMLLLDLNGWALVEAQKAGVFSNLSREGVNLSGVVYDILPIIHPSYFPAGSEEAHRGWLQTIALICEQLICISEAVADETSKYLSDHLEHNQQPDVNWFHLGADIAQSAASEGWDGEHDALEQQLRGSTSFLMVGTIEPRKGHLQTIQAVSHLLDQGENITLVIVGKKGWMIDNVIAELNNNPHVGHGIHWLSGISDEYLSHLYATCNCLIAASEAEGFGLPLIEAAMQSMPIVSRDIPVFREVAGEAAFYFHGDTTDALASALTTWMHQFERHQHPKPEKLHWMSWRESSEQLLHLLDLSSSP